MESSICSACVPACIYTSVEQYSGSVWMSIASSRSTQATQKLTASLCCINTLEVTASSWKILLTLGAHAPQCYSSWLCLCVRFAFFHTVTNRPRRPTDRLSAAINWFKMCFFVEQPLRKATEFASKLLAHLSAILLAITGAQAYI